MQSRIQSALKMKYSPVAILWQDDKPEGALEFAEGRWGCVMSLVTTAAKGRPSVARRETVGCGGGVTGIGFGIAYDSVPGGIENFLSTGNPEYCNTEEGRRLAEARPDILHGERYIKSPELARQFVESLPIVDIPTKYVVFKPLELVGDDETPKVVIFLVNPDQLSALVVLANYGRSGQENVTIPMGAGCHQIGIFPYHEAESANPRAVVGLTDISARKVTGRAVGRDILSFAVPYKMYAEMEGDVEGSFLQRDSWAAVVAQWEV